MSNVVELRPVSAHGVDQYAIPRNYFAVIDERGHEHPILSGSIERALAEAESLECLGASEKGAARSALRLVSNESVQSFQAV